jgi:hypothetical protein
MIVSTRSAVLAAMVLAAGCSVGTGRGRRIGVGPVAPLTAQWMDRHGELAPMESLIAPTDNPLDENPVPLTPDDEDAMRAVALLLASLAVMQLPLLGLFGSF